MKVHKRIAVEHHIAQRLVHPGERAGHLFKGFRKPSYIAPLNGPSTLRDRRQGMSGLRLDINMHDNEPLLIDSSEEVLRKSHITNRYGSIRIQTLPVVERVRFIRENWRPTTPLCDLMPWSCENFGNSIYRWLFTKHIRVTDE
jgi:hypothetical protein